ncbi:hypothetical protein H0H87_008812 [Tephrocybe sp. NHM501043]|nr:hypothetical protein H0H87_012977 [Tephrocybe sp. NHM501043]KAG6813972.1 hypothetical protein H0H87_008811 [Tephrocybe sp. NHM501043]KAG6853147.1 hypothetical protein H0H87_008812 [Tephrocybe sp. NHM501043]
MSNLETASCPTLTGPENFQIWKICITAKLRQEKVWDVITTLPNTQNVSTQMTSTTSPGNPSTEPAPTSITTTTSQATSSCTDSWAVRDEKAASLIIAYVSDRLALQIGKLLHAKDMFDKLVTIHVNTNIGVTTFYTFISMLSLKWDGSLTTLSDHIAAISAADSKLTAMKKNIDKEFLAFILLYSLP